MSKGQRGNKEAKKPKKEPPAAKPLAPMETLQAAASVAPNRLKKK